MTLRWYVMPTEDVVLGDHTVHQPQFLLALAPAAEWGWLPINDDWAVGWADLSDADHATYDADAGVLFLTADLTATLTAGQVTGVRNRLAARNLPSAWVDTTDAWSQIIKRIYGFIQCIQRYYGETSNSLNVGVPVTTLVSSLPQAVQDKFDVVAATFPSGPLPAVKRATDTMETLLMRWSNTLLTRPVYVGMHSTLGQIQL